MSRKRRGVTLDCLGPSALRQLQAAGVDVSRQLRAKGQSVAPPAPRGHKFNVSASADRTHDGIVFDSKMEMNVYKLLRRYDIQFTRQPKFVLQEGYRDAAGKKVRDIVYVGDFLLQRADGVTFVVDVKGMRTPIYRLKEKMMQKAGTQVHCLKNVPQMLAFLHDRGFLASK